MPMKLFCVRHGEAQDPSVDPNRPLTSQGREDIQKIAMHLKNCGITVAHILHSDKLRAQQTAEIIASALNVDHVTQSEHLLDAEGSIFPILEMLPSWHENTMLVGHLPFMYELVSALVVNDQNFFPLVDFPPGTVICLEFYEMHRWIIRWHLTPQIIPNR